MDGMTTVRKRSLPVRLGSELDRRAYPVTLEGDREDIYDVAPSFLDVYRYQKQLLQQISILPPANQPCKTGRLVARLLHAHPRLEVWTLWNETLLARIINTKINARKQRYAILRIGRYEEETEKESIFWLALWTTVPMGESLHDRDAKKPGIKIQIQTDGRLTNPSLFFPVSFRTGNVDHVVIRPANSDERVYISDKETAKYNYKSLAANWLQQGYANPKYATCEVFNSDHLRNGVDEFKRESHTSL